MLMVSMIPREILLGPLRVAVSDAVSVGARKLWKFSSVFSVQMLMVPSNLHDPPRDPAWLALMPLRVSWLRCWQRRGPPLLKGVLDAFRANSDSSFTICMIPLEILLGSRRCRSERLSPTLTASAPASFVDCWTESSAYDSALYFHFSFELCIPMPWSAHTATEGQSVHRPLGQIGRAHV